MRVYDCLGTDKPHILIERMKEEKVDEDEEEVKRPLSPMETGSAGAALYSIDVKSVGYAKHVNTKDNVDVRGGEDDDAPAAPEDQIRRSGSRRDTSSELWNGSKTSDKVSTAKLGASRKLAARAKKRASEVNGDAGRTLTKPYEGLFEVSLKMDLSPPMLEFKDLRQGVFGGEKVWQEPILCLVCNSRIN
jgi:hypothetical protein